MLRPATFSTVFLLALVAAQDGCKAPVTLSGPSGQLSSPYYEFYPNFQYPSDLMCQFRIHVPIGQNISIKFDSPFSTEGNCPNSCRLDYVTIYDGDRESSTVCNPYTNSTPLAGETDFAQVCAARVTSDNVKYQTSDQHGPFCGSGVDFTAFVVQGPTAVVEFCTDGSVQGQGFRLQFNATSAPVTPAQEFTPAPPTGAPGPTGPCGGEYAIDLLSPNSSSVCVQSPNYPGDYDSNSRCIWTVTFPLGNVWTVDAVDFLLENGPDYLELYDGSVLGILIGTFTGRNGPIRTRGNSNVLTILFVSDDSIERRGFDIRVWSPKCSSEYSKCPNDPDGDECAFHPSMLCDGKNDCPNGADENCAVGCGVPHTKPYLSSSGRIVHGIEARPHSWPWQAALLNRVGGGFLFCGGTVIDHYFILSAAHCCEGAVAANTLVRVGDHSESGSREPNSQTHVVKHITMHPRYTARYGLSYDFCLLETETPMFYNNDVMPACLPSGVDAPDGQRCYVTGWGETDQRNHTARGGVLSVEPKTAESKGPRQADKDTSDALRQVDVKILSQQECNIDYPGWITRDMLCAENLGDSCQGDSGGPMVCPSQDDPNRFELHGVVSWAFGCADSRYPGVNARVSVAMDWIADTMMAQRTALKSQ